MDSFPVFYSYFPIFFHFTLFCFSFFPFPHSSFYILPWFYCCLRPPPHSGGRSNGISIRQSKRKGLQLSIKGFKEKWRQPFIKGDKGVEAAPFIQILREGWNIYYTYVQKCGGLCLLNLDLPTNNFWRLPSWNRKLARRVNLKSSKQQSCPFRYHINNKLYFI